MLLGVCGPQGQYAAIKRLRSREARKAASALSVLQKPLTRIRSELL